MESKEFATIRKKLAKTQKEIATLIGISLKSVCSYEQGWRIIPGHVERHILFLLSRKNRRKQENCWELRKCPEEKKNKCPAWEFDSGQFCWFISGTICGNTTHKTLDEKLSICRKCVVMKDLK